MERGGLPRYGGGNGYWTGYTIGIGVLLSLLESKTDETEPEREEKGIDEWDVIITHVTLWYAMVYGCNEICAALHGM